MFPSQRLSVALQGGNAVAFLATFISSVAEDTRETTFLSQRLSVALQGGNAVAFLATFCQLRTEV